MARLRLFSLQIQILWWKKYEFEAGFSKLLKTGGTVSLSLKGYKQEQTMFISSMGDVNSKSFGSEIMLTISHPLLAGFGVKITKSEIEKSGINIEVEKLKLKVESESLIRDLIISYISLQSLWNRYEILLKGLEVSQSQLKLTKAMLEGDRATQSDLLAVKTAVAQREGELIKIKSAILSSSLKLKLLMGIPMVKKPWIYKPQMDENAILKSRVPDNFLKVVIKRSKDLLILDKKIQLLNEDLIVARNSLLPRLDAVLSAGPTSSSSTFSDAMKRLVKFQAFIISAGLSFSYSMPSHAGIKSKVKIWKLRVI